MSSVLFLCTGNSARSQLAEALFRHMAGDDVQVYSAGTQPQMVDDRVYKVLAQQGIETSKLHCKMVSDLPVSHFDVVITLCDNAKNECDTYPESDALIHWDISDPKPVKGIAPFQATLMDLQERIRLFLKVNAPDNSTHLYSPTDLFKQLSDNTRLRILMLIEDERELCVSELTAALQETQPKISRHLAQLRTLKILTVRRQAQLIHYRLSDALPAWVQMVLATIRNGHPDFINDEKIRLKCMEGRPVR
ncbi:phosphotyrosine protein phosphatase [Endozoicomonas sp. (ex Bugula neritina AB1)]|nr:phosphotyrosine protein phosphatase [Endozoicomonas sp. (ex Bugula neritina AB1)]